MSICDEGVWDYIYTKFKLRFILLDMVDGYFASCCRIDHSGGQPCAP
jgi:hypothetical protein